MIVPGWRFGQERSVKITPAAAGVVVLRAVAHFEIKAVCPKWKEI